MGPSETKYLRKLLGADSLVVRTMNHFTPRPISGSDWLTSNIPPSPHMHETTTSTSPIFLNGKHITSSIHSTQKMALVQDPEHIKTNLQAFIQSPPRTFESPSTLIYGKTHLGPPKAHPKILDILPSLSDPVYKPCGTLLRGTLNNHILFRVTIHNSMLINCTLISCTIYGSRISKCHLKDCRIRKKAFGFDNSFLEITSFLSHCEIEGGGEYDAEIFKSKLKSLDPVRSCDIESSLASDSLAIDCTFIKSGVNESKLCDCEVLSRVVMENVVKAKMFYVPDCDQDHTFRGGIIS
jgi:hypothetical protein